MAVAFGRYELLKKIASGGMGQVFLGRTAAQGFQKLVVIKRILPHLVEDEEFLTMFFEEARIAARLNHPNLVQIFELDQVNGMHYLAMEYLPGDDVRRVERAARKQGRSLPVGVACRIVADAAAGLDYAHKVRGPRGEPLNLIHRDVSPQNILVGFDGGVKLIDFGVARAAGRAQHTATGILKGKYPYMSPEQIAGEAYDHTSDQFALGTVFWEILTSRRLFKGDSDLVTMRLVRECNVPPPSQLCAELPKGLDELVLKALSPAPADRFADCGELRMALEEFIVSRHLAASSAHLSAFMRELYAERIERESDSASLDELSGASAFDESGLVMDSGSVRMLEPVPMPPQPVQPARPTPAREVTRALTQTHRRSRRPLAIAAVAGALLALGAAVPFFAGGDGPAPLVPAPVAPTPLPPPQAEVAQPEPAAAPVAAPPPAPVRLELRSEPPGALVKVAGEAVGSTPVEFLLSPGTQSATATFTKPGYEPLETTLRADGAPVVEVQLKRRRGAPRGSPPPLEIKTGR